MPPIEAAFILVVALGAASALLPYRSPLPLRAIYAVLVALLFVAQLGLVGPHWQMIPAYLALWLFAQRLLRQRLRTRDALATLLACAVSFAFCFTLPVFKLPPPTGSYAVGTSGPFSASDPSRGANGIAGSPGQREVVVQIWYPAAAGQPGARARYSRWADLKPLLSYKSQVRTNSLMHAPIAPAGTPFPVLLFGHRWGGDRVQDTFLAEDLASHGYVVVSIDHPGNAARVQLADGTVVHGDPTNALGNVDASSSAAIEALWARELRVWVADDRFVLDTIAQGDLSRSLDISRVGAFGHSFGGAASIALLGVDPRVQCAVNLDGWTFNALDHRTTQPVLFVYEQSSEGSSEARKPKPGTEGELDAADNTAVDRSLAKFGGLRAYVAGTQHLDFTDQTLVSPFQRLTYTGPIHGDRIRTITRGLVLGFFNQNLRNTGQIPNFPEVQRR